MILWTGYKGLEILVFIGRVIYGSLNRPDFSLGGLRADLVVGVVGGLILIGVAFASGIGALRLQRWARPTLIAIAVLVLLGDLLDAWLMQPVPAPLERNWGLVSLLLRWAFCGAILHVMLRSEVRAAFRGELRSPQRT